jgi:hypothetical protein
MTNLRKKIRNIIKEVFLTEIKKSINDLQTNYALIITESSPILDFVLFNVVDNKIVGEISAYKYSNMKNYAVSTVAAESGYGPVMYEILMTYVNPNGIVASRDDEIREGAYNIY